MSRATDLPTIETCVAAGTHMIRCTADGDCKVCFQRGDTDITAVVPLPPTPFPTPAAAPTESLHACREDTLRATVEVRTGRGGRDRWTARLRASGHVSLELELAMPSNAPMPFSWSAEWTGAEIVGIKADDLYTDGGDDPLPERLLSFIADCFRAAAETSGETRFHTTLEDVVGPFIAPEPVAAATGAGEPEEG